MAEVDMVLVYVRPYSDKPNIEADVRIGEYKFERLPIQDEPLGEVQQAAGKLLEAVERAAVAQVRRWVDREK